MTVEQVVAIKEEREAIAHGIVEAEVPMVDGELMGILPIELSEHDVPVGGGQVKALKNAHTRMEAAIELRHTQQRRIVALKHPMVVGQLSREVEEVLIEIAQARVGISLMGIVVENPREGHIVNIAIGGLEERIVDNLIACAQVEVQPLGDTEISCQMGIYIRIAAVGLLVNGPVGRAGVQRTERGQLAASIYSEHSREGRGGKVVYLAVRRGLQRSCMALTEEIEMGTGNKAEIAMAIVPSGIYTPCMIALI
jgi:hypothetical protein